MNKERFEYLSELSIIQKTRYNYNYIINNLFNSIGQYNNIPIYSFAGSRFVYDISTLIKMKSKFRTAFDLFNCQYCGFRFKSMCDYMLSFKEHESRTSNFLYLQKEMSESDLIMWYYLLYKNNKENFIIRILEKH